MTSMTDLATIMNLAAERNCRVLITGDHEQLAAVEGGGGMLMLTRQLGYAQLAEPVRFTSSWERDASLRLRSGDTTVLAVYDQQGRIRGGDAEQAMDLACRAWLADHLAGRDTLLLARTEEQARELSRRIRDDLRHYGIVTDRDQVGLRESAIASAGDLIMARHNDRRIQAGAPGRWLTNRDVLRIERTQGRAVIVRRLAGRDENTGQPVWTTPFELPRTYLLLHGDLAYATTIHAAEGRTTGICHLLVDGLLDRQSTYVGLSRGRYANYAYCVTGPRAADPLPGSRPDPELGRFRRIADERAGRAQPDSPPSDARSRPGQRDPIAVLAESLTRDGSVTSATETLRAELSNADHLAVLSSIWYDLTRREQATRYEHLLRQHLTAAHAEAALADPACTWLWRTLREAETTGQDANDVLRHAIADRSLRGSRHIARVIDARIRRANEHAVPQPRQPWTQQLHPAGDPELDQFIAELAHAMDDRVIRIGQHIAQTEPAWAIRTLGELPNDRAQRAQWTARAAHLGAYREMYGYSSLVDAIGPEPGRASPEARADWYTASAALGRIDGIDLRSCSDGQLHLRRATYQQEASWAPPYVADDLRLARLQQRTAYENHIREQHESQAARDPETAARHSELVTAWQDMHARITKAVEQLAEAQETRRQWETLTEPRRELAQAADQELRRRHPEQIMKPPHSAEPDVGTVFLPSRDQETAWLQMHPTGDEAVWDQIAERVGRLAEQAQAAQAKIEDLRATRLPGEAPEVPDLGTGQVLSSRHRSAIVHPAQQNIVPAGEVLRRAEARRAVSVLEAEST